MPIGLGVRIKITLRYQQAGQNCENVQWYTTDGAAFLTADMPGVLEAYWNDIKTAWRALIVTSSSFKFTELLGAEESPTGAFGSFPVPLAEQLGTRAAGSLGNFLPSFAAAGVKLTVATRVTRPGQKRLPGIMEGDNDNGTLEAGYIALADPVAEVYSVPRVLGAPVATGVLTPVICHLDPITDLPVASQEVTGHVINQFISSQVSRKIGHGN
jgi:hypothetical protein